MFMCSLCIILYYTHAQPLAFYIYIKFSCDDKSHHEMEILYCALIFFCDKEENIFLNANPETDFRFFLLSSETFLRFINKFHEWIFYARRVP